MPEHHPPGGRGKGMENKAQISVIIPVYNAEIHLRECLESIVSQTLKDIEIICVDDGSTDSTPEILREYEAKDNRVKVITQQNQYAGVARNRGMQAACGRYYAFMDADDYFEPFALELMLGYVERYDLDVVKAAFYNLQENFELYDTEYSVNGTLRQDSFERVLGYPDDLKELIQIADVPWNGLYRTDFVKKNNIKFNDLQVTNDHSFFIQCILNTKRLMVIEKHVVIHREKQSSSLVGQKSKHFDCQLENYKLIRNYAIKLPPAEKHLLLQWEFNGLLYWYQKLRSETNGEHRDKIDLQMAEFLLDFDENDVGSVYLSRMENRNLFYSFKKQRFPKNISEIHSRLTRFGGQVLSSLPEKIQYAIWYYDTYGFNEFMRKVLSFYKKNRKKANDSSDF